MSTPDSVNDFAFYTGPLLVRTNSGPLFPQPDPCPDSPCAQLVSVGAMSLDLQAAFTAWRDPQYSTSAKGHVSPIRHVVGEQAPMPAPVRFTRKGKCVSALQPGDPPGLSLSPSTILGAYSLSSSDGEVEVHPELPPQANTEGMDEDGETQFHFCDRLELFRLSLLLGGSSDRARPLQAQARHLGL